MMISTLLSKLQARFDKFVEYMTSNFELIIDTKNGDFDMKVYIAPLNGRYGLYRKADGQLIGTYARGRDARRGARRKGLQVA